MHFTGRTPSMRMQQSARTAGVRCYPPPSARPESGRTRQRRVQQTQGSRRSKISSPCSAASTDAAATSSAASSTVDYFAADKRPVILFDGVCNMCNGGVNFVLDWDKAGVYRFAALQSNPGRQLLVRCGRRPDDISSIVLVEAHGCYIKSEAVLRIATKLGMPWPLLAGLALLTPRFVRWAAWQAYHTGLLSLALSIY
eukprot:GHUV01035749.1.p1 GENE.GHUV01035749.1~~GHUV01035749.1.p1  ORF type:complete len:198 (+),score=38.37 GHUV01035749.1:122-715(+)